MGTPRIHLRISDDANDALKKVVARFPKWSLAQLGDALIVESCRAILADGQPEFPTVDYIRLQMRVPALKQAAEEFNSAAAAQGKPSGRRRAA